MNVERNVQLKFEAVYCISDRFSLWRPVTKEKEGYLDVPYENASTISFSSDSSSSLLSDDTSERISVIEDIDTESQNDPYFERTRFATSYSTPLKYPSKEAEESPLIDCYYVSVHERAQFLKEIEQIKEGITQLKGGMSLLESQMSNMELDLIHSKKRVFKVEEGLTVTQEANVNFQILLEKSLKKQKKTDKYATRAMQRIFSSLSNVAHETNRLKGKMIAIADEQKKRQGCAEIIAGRIREYMHLLEQAQGTIHSLKQKRQMKHGKPFLKDDSKKASEESRNKNKSADVLTKVPTTATTTSATTDAHAKLYRHRIIRKKVFTPEMTGDSPLTQSTNDLRASPWLPQRGLRILLDDYYPKSELW